jgi:hypothetical protein
MFDMVVQRPHLSYQITTQDATERCAYHATMKQKIINGLTVTLILMLAGVVVGVLVLDGLAQSIIQKQGSQGLGTQLLVERVHVGFFDTASSFHGMTIANPEGFGGEDFPTLLSINEAAAVFGLQSFLDKPVAIPNATISGVTLYLEQVDEKSNIEIIIANVLSNESESVSEASFTIETLTMTDITVVASGKFTAAGSGSVTAHIDEIVLTNIGTASNGEIAVEAITTAVTDAIMQHLVEHPAEGLSKVAFSHVTDLINTLPVFKELELGSAIQEVTDELGKGVDGLLEEFSDLFD